VGERERVVLAQFLSQLVLQPLVGARGDGPQGNHECGRQAHGPERGGEDEDQRTHCQYRHACARSLTLSFPVRAADVQRQPPHYRYIRVFFEPSIRKIPHPGIACSLQAGVVDLHCHILPALDDGARSLADSVAMARQAQADGIAVVCATPHIRADHDVRIDQIARRVEELEVELAREGVAVRVLSGGEVAAHAAETLTPQELRLVSLAGAGWILLEPAPGPLGRELLELVERRAARGERTIVAHPERHAGEHFEAHLRALVERGCLIQWTAEFIARTDPGDPEDFVLGLARDGLVHLLGSDAHSSLAGRPVQLGEGVARLAEVLPAERVRWIAETAPWAILRGEPVAPPW
jgi:protein-tyrosine phosphatase